MENRSNHILTKSPIPYASSDDNILVFILVCYTGYNGFHLSTSNDRRYWFLYLSAYPTQRYPVYLRPENTGCAKNEKKCKFTFIPKAACEQNAWKHMLGCQWHILALFTYSIEYCVSAVSHHLVEGYRAWEYHHDKKSGFATSMKCIKIYIYLIFG